MFTDENDPYAVEDTTEIVREDPVRAFFIVVGGIVLAFLTHMVWENRIINVMAAELPMFAVVVEAMTTRFIIAKSEQNEIEMRLIHVSLLTIVVAIGAGMLLLAIPEHYTWLGIFIVTPIVYSALPLFDELLWGRNDLIDVIEIAHTILPNGAKQGHVRSKLVEAIEDDLLNGFIEAGERESRLSEQLIEFRNSHIRHEVAARMGLAEFEARSF